MGQKKSLVSLFAMESIVFFIVGTVCIRDVKMTSLS